MTQKNHENDPLKGPRLHLNFDFRSHLSTMSAENTPKSGSLKQKKKTEIHNSWTTTIQRSLSSEKGFSLKMVTKLVSILAKVCQLNFELKYLKSP